MVKNNQKIALMLPGGGARGAYQVGVLKGIIEIIENEKNIFPIITGTSAGAINAAVMASYAKNFQLGVQRLEKFWTNIHCHDIYRTDGMMIAKTMARVIGSILFPSMINSPKSLLDNSPLKRLLTNELHLEQIQLAIESGDLSGLALTASSYDTAEAKSFYQSHTSIIPWHRTRRYGIPATIGVEHILASASLPFLFPAQLIGKEHFGDGGLRMTAPLSPSIHLGAEKILIIGTRDEVPIPSPTEISEYPSMGELGGYMLDTIFMDTLIADISRLKRINHTVSLLNEQQLQKTNLKHIETMVIMPSFDVREVTKKHANDIPRHVRTLLKMIGGWGKDWRMPSYLLFEPSYTKSLIDLGYQDSLKKSDEIKSFLL